MSDETAIFSDYTIYCWKCKAKLNSDGSCPNGCEEYKDMFGDE